MFRINFAPLIDRLSEYIGTKTSMRVHTHVHTSTILGPSFCGHHGASKAPYHFTEYCVAGIQYRGFFHQAASAVENASTAGPIPLLYSSELIKKVQALHALVASAHPGWSPYRFPSTGQLTLLLAINLCETPPDVYGFFPSQKSAFDSTVGAGDLGHVPLHDDPRQPREQPGYNPRLLYEFHSYTLDHHVLEYLDGSGAVRWHNHDNSEDA